MVETTDLAEEMVESTSTAIFTDISYDKDDIERNNSEIQEKEAENEVSEPEDADEIIPSNSINPLTGLPVDNPENLMLPPALVSVTNFPPTARPQAGLSSAPIVYELYIGDGMTRYLAIFYGDYPASTERETPFGVQKDLTEGMVDAEIGPIRSGRLPYEYVRQLYNGFIVMASAYSKVADQLGNFTNVYGDDRSNVNSALIAVEDLENIAQENNKEMENIELSGMVFETDTPAGGEDAHSLWIHYAYRNQVFWRFEEDDGSYHRWQDDADGATFIEQTDRLNDDPLTFENVIILFANHEVENSYLIDINLLYVKKGKAVLFRDGRMYDIYWTTRSEEYEKTTGKLRPIRFIDTEGNPFPLKPGQTWIELIPDYSPFWETADTEKYHILFSSNRKGSGYWALDFELGD